jgi:hypothetical protein
MGTFILVAAFGAIGIGSSFVFTSISHGASNHGIHGKTAIKDDDCCENSTG